MTDGTTPAMPATPESFWARLKAFWTSKALKHAIPVLLIIILVMSFLEVTRPFEYVKGALVDAFTRSDKIEMPNNLLIVEISGDDYTDFFKATSPLDPNVVLQLITALQPVRPSVVALDLDTSDAQWACVDPLKVQNLLPESKFVWAQVPLQSHGGERSAEEAARITLGPVLGGKITDEKQMGLARFPQGEDGYVRQFRSTYEVEGKLPAALPCPPSPQDKIKQAPSQTPVSAQTTPVETGTTREMPAFFRAIAEAYHQADPTKSKLAELSEKTKYLQFTGTRHNFYTVGANHLLTKDEKGHVVAKSFTAEGLQKPIVLVGGAFPEARDEYYTPFGSMPGVELIANAVETELGRGVTELGPWTLRVIDFCFGLLIVFIYFVNADRPIHALGWSLGAMGLVVAVGALFYYGVGAFLNFVPVMAGMVIHQMIEGTQQAAELKEQVSKLRKDVVDKDTEIAHLKSELGEARLDMAFEQPASPVPAATLPIAPLIIVETTESTTVVEKEPEHSHAAGKGKKTHTHKRGHAAGK
jgi:CHASE2 domain-containing sensor protein